MDGNMNDVLGVMAFTDSCMKSAGNFFESLLRGDSTPSGDGNKKGGRAEGDDPLNAMTLLLQNWERLSGDGSFKGGLGRFMAGGEILPDTMMNLNRNLVENALEIQKDIIESMDRISQSTGGVTFKDTDASLLQVWHTIYDHEISRFFQIPQLGLLRTYQEKIGRMVDKYNRFQTNLSEFIRLLSLPFKKSQNVLAQKMGELGDGADISEKTRDCYRKWVKVLEDNFMSLFQTPEYVTTLSLTMSALADFIAVRDDAIEDLLKFFPVARKSDMDDMARELYALKKRLRKLEMASAHNVTP